MATKRDDVFMVVGANEGRPLELLALPEEEQRYSVLRRTPDGTETVLQSVTWEDALGWLDCQRRPH